MQSGTGVETDYAAGEQVEHHREIQQTFLGPDVEDINASFLTGSLGFKHLAEQVRRHCPVMLNVYGPFEPALLASY
jgi:hypothetical protein